MMSLRSLLVAMACSLLAGIVHAQSDECNDAVQLPLNPEGQCNAISGSTIGATDSGVSSNCFYGGPPFNRADVWYKVSGGPSNVTVTLTPSSSLPSSIWVGMDVYDVCGGNSLACSTASFNQNGGVASATVSFSLVSMAVPRYIRVKSGGGQVSFTICATETQSNDLCSSATQLPLYQPGACVPTEASTAVATNSGPNCYSGSPSLRDVWYAVTGGPAGVVIINLTPGTAGGTRGVQVFGACGGSQTFCEYGGGNTYTFAVPEGQTRYVKVFFSTPGIFSVCAIAPQAGSCPSPAMLDVRVMLEGSYDTSAGLMKDDLRSAGMVPLSEPYTALGYTHMGGGGGEAISPEVLQTTGNNAVVDWVVVELRAATDPGRRIATRCGLLQRDGDVRDMDNVSPLGFCVPSGAYFVAIRHRNHLGVMSGDPVQVNGYASLDLSDPTKATWRYDSRKAMGGIMAMWAGDVNFDGTIRYTGQGNDRDVVLSKVGGVVPTATVTGFEQGDVNLNGVVQYTGQENDRDRILQNIGGVVPTATRTGYIPKDTLALRTRVHVVDSLEWVLDTTASNMTDLSTLVYSLSGPQPDVLPDDIVVGMTGAGYLRKVTNVGFAGFTMTLETVQASLSDVFLSGVVSFSVSNVEDTAQTNGFAPVQSNSFTFPGLQWELGAGIEVSVQDLEWQFDYIFKPVLEFGAGYADLAIHDITAQLSGTLNVTAASVSIGPSPMELKLMEWPVVVFIPVPGIPLPLPVKVITELKAVGGIEFALQGELDLSVPFSLQLGMDAGFVYQNGALQNITQWNTPEASMSTSLSVSTAGGSLEGYVGLEFSSKIYGVAGPYVSVHNKAGFSVEHSLSAPEWNYTRGEHVDLAVGVEAEIFNSLLNVNASYTHSIPLGQLTWPGMMNAVSGNGQTGQPGLPLAQPLRVQVQETYENALTGTTNHSAASGARVHFDVVAGGGSVSNTVVVGDEEGYAETIWTLGPSGDQRLKAYVLKANGDTLEGGPVVFLPEQAGCPGAATVADIDGNVYPVVQIGNQCWMAENLRTTRYHDGSSIPNVTDSVDWQWLTTGAWCNYQNNPGYDAVYGKLYNWYAAANPNICPLGWHVPSQADLTDLANYLGGGSVAGGKLKTTGTVQGGTGLWEAPNTGASNETGFSALPSGARSFSSSGTFLNLGTRGGWWSTSEGALGYALGIALGHDYVQLHFGDGSYKQNGICVRCLRD